MGDGITSCLYRLVNSIEEQTFTEYNFRFKAMAMYMSKYGKNKSMLT